MAENCHILRSRRRIRNLMLYPAELRAHGIFPRETANPPQGSAIAARNITEPSGTFGHISFHIPRHNKGPGSLAGTEARPNRVGGGMADETYIPEGYSAEEWAAMCRCAEVLDWERPRKRDVIDVRSYSAAPERRGFIYFIGGSSGPVKIGFTGKLKTRLMRLNLGSPVPLRILASRPGTRSDERCYHLRFMHLRQRGEWFERHPDILAEIAHLTESPTS